MSLPASAAETGMHESFHAAASIRLGIGVEEVLRERDGHGLMRCEQLDLTAENVMEQAIKIAVVIMAPFIGGCTGVRRDLRKLAQFERWGVPLDEARLRCAQLVTDPEFIKLRWRFFDRLMEQPHLTAGDVREIVAT